MLYEVMQQLWAKRKETSSFYVDETFFKKEKKDVGQIISRRDEKSVQKSLSLRRSTSYSATRVKGLAS